MKYFQHQNNSQVKQMMWSFNYKLNILTNFQDLTYEIKLQKKKSFMTNSFLKKKKMDYETRSL